MWRHKGYRDAQGQQQIIHRDYNAVLKLRFQRAHVISCNNLCSFVRIVAGSVCRNDRRPRELVSDYRRVN